MEYFLAAVVAGILLFIVLHLRPLTDYQVRSLCTKRRKKNIEAYFHADNAEQSVNPDFKKSLNPRGVFYQVDLPLCSAASIVAGLLKYKKHEWIVVAFEKQKQVGHLCRARHKCPYVESRIMPSNFLKLSRNGVSHRFR
ncbi:MAG: hypothetical protein NTW55_00550 [Planctomycetota bacterium]|nr:hypothetical protein [Planctomycetota bacterium]